MYTTVLSRITHHYQNFNASCWLSYFEQVDSKELAGPLSKRNVEYSKNKRLHRSETKTSQIILVSSAHAQVTEVKNMERAIFFFLTPNQLFLCLCLHHLELPLTLINIMPWKRLSNGTSLCLLPHQALPICSLPMSSRHKKLPGTRCLGTYKVGMYLCMFKPLT